MQYHTFVSNALSILIRDNWIQTPLIKFWSVRCYYRKQIELWNDTKRVDCFAFKVGKFYTIFIENFKKSEIFYGVKFTHFSPNNISFAKINSKFVNRMRLIAITNIRLSRSFLKNILVPVKFYL